MLHIARRHYLNAEKIIAFADRGGESISSPLARCIRKAEDNNLLIDITNGRKTNSVIFMDSGHVIISDRCTDTLNRRIKGQNVKVGGTD